MTAGDSKAATTIIATRARLISAIAASSDEPNTTARPRRSNGSKLEADEGANSYPD